MSKNQNNLLNTIDDFLKVLNRYSFEEKINLVHRLSMNCFSVFADESLDQVGRDRLPWVAEAISILAIESKDRDFYLKTFDSTEGKKTKARLVNSVVEVLPPCDSGYGEGRSVFNPLIGQQLISQTDVLVYLYRCHRLLESCLLWKEKFAKMSNGHSYIFYCGVVYFVELSRRAEPIAFDVKKKRFQKLIDQYKDAFLFLAKTREELRVLDSNCFDETSISELVYSAKSVALFPIIRIGEQLLLWLPHLLGQSLSTELVISLDDGNGSNQMRAEVGQEINKYFYGLIKESGCYDELNNDQVLYGNKKERHGPADVAVLEDGAVILYELKLGTPKIKSQINQKEAIRNDTKKIIEACEESLRVYSDYLSGEYDPFSKQHSENQEVFLVVATFFQQTIDIKYIREKLKSAFCLPQIKEVIETRLFICSLYDLETFYINKKSPLAEFRKNSVKRFPDSFRTNGFVHSPAVESYEAFEAACEKEISSICSTLESKT